MDDIIKKLEEANKLIDKMDEELYNKFVAIRVHPESPYIKIFKDVCGENKPDVKIHSTDRAFLIPRFGEFRVYYDETIDPSILIRMSKQDEDEYLEQIKKGEK